jgi:hypothetical protein
MRQVALFDEVQYGIEVLYSTSEVDASSVVHVSIAVHEAEVHVCETTTVGPLSTCGAVKSFETSTLRTTVGAAFPAASVAVIEIR